MADAGDLKSLACKGVWVRIPPPAYFIGCQVCALCASESTSRVRSTLFQVQMRIKRIPGTLIRSGLLAAFGRRVSSGPTGGFKPPPTIYPAARATAVAPRRVDSYAGRTNSCRIQQVGVSRTLAGFSLRKASSHQLRRVNYGRVVRDVKPDSCRAGPLLHSGRCGG